MSTLGSITQHEHAPLSIAELRERTTVTVPQYAALIGISATSAYELAKRDELGVKVLHLGRRLVIPARAVLRVLELD